MYEHFNLNSNQVKSLKKSNVEIVDLYNMLELFGPTSQHAINHLSLYYFADNRGNFIPNPIEKCDRVARMVWDNLPINQKLNIASYAEACEDGEI